MNDKTEVTTGWTSDVIDVVAVSMSAGDDGILGSYPESVSVAIDCDRTSKDDDKGNFDDKWNAS
jgi:hypothetical protein